MIDNRGWHLTTVKLAPEMWEAAKKNLIKFSEAMRVGISLLLAEKGVAPYNNKLNIVRRIDLLRKQLEETTRKYLETEEGRSELKNAQ